MKVVVLAGGQGTRMSPYTDLTPKCLLYVGNKPAIRWVTDKLIDQGFDDIIMCVNRRHEGMFKHEYRDMNIKFNPSESAGTAGEVALIKEHLRGEDFMLVYGDDLTNIDYGELCHTYVLSVCVKDIIGTLVLTNKVSSDVGHVDLDENGYVKQFREKPYINAKIWTGTAVLSYDIVAYCGKGKDFARDVFPQLLEEGKKLTSCEFDSEWRDIGILSHFKRADELAREGKL